MQRMGMPPLLEWGSSSLMVGKTLTPSQLMERRQALQVRFWYVVCELRSDWARFCTPQTG